MGVDSRDSHSYVYGPVPDACFVCHGKRLASIHNGLLPVEGEPEPDGYTHREVIGGYAGPKADELCPACLLVPSNMTHVCFPQPAPSITDEREARQCSGCHLRYWSEDGHDCPAPAPSITDEARRLVAGERADAYGPAEASFAKIGRLWGALLGIEDIEPRKVALLLEALKVGREFNKASRDNRVDGVGYWLLADRLAAGDD